METACLPCRIVFNGGLPISVRLAFYSMASVKLQGVPMWRSVVLGVAVFSMSDVASAQPMSLSPPEPRSETSSMAEASTEPQMQSRLGGGFIEFLFGDSTQRPQRESRQWYGAPPPQDYYRGEQVGQQPYASSSLIDPMQGQRSVDRMDARFVRQEVAYDGKETPGTIVIDTPNHFLYLVESDGRAMRYGIGVGRPGFTWSGAHAVSGKKEWPDWVPPDEMIKRQPYLPHFVAGGPNNPLGARALYLGSTLYRIHGSNEPWTIGQNVSSGCIRMRNVDVIDLYDRVKVGTKVVVL
jgi:lipoprotein-anchoring transpeptidase ErfK/SrfK